ncbi:hypothetical protein AB0451_34750 [Streptomyces sp. NPDC052000]|uniref:hypothetical protein n=1 Tax=Streptomyces sp. NPDC052000 TaxID=3155676 RepID=UPI003450EE98
MSKMTAVEIADTLIETFQWKDVRPQPVGPDRARIVLDGKWVGITTSASPYRNDVLLQTGLVHDGTPANTAGQCTVDDAGNLRALVNTLEDLWQDLGWGPVVMSLTDAAQYILDKHDRELDT